MYLEDHLQIKSIREAAYRKCHIVGFTELSDSLNGDTICSIEYDSFGYPIKYCLFQIFAPMVKFNYAANGFPIIKEYYSDYTFPYRILYKRDVANRRLYQYWIINALNFENQLKEFYIDSCYYEFDVDGKLLSSKTVPALNSSPSSHMIAKYAYSKSGKLIHKYEHLSFKQKHPYFGFLKNNPDSMYTAYFYDKESLDSSISYYFLQEGELESYPRNFKTTTYYKAFLPQRTNLLDGEYLTYFYEK